MLKNVPPKKKVLAAALLCTALISMPQLTMAQSAETFDGSKARVNLSNKLLMLGQIVSSASCRISAGYGSDVAMKELASAHSDFNTILDGIEKGSMALGIPSGERYPVVQETIAEVRAAWAPINAASEDILAGNAASASAETIANNNLALLDATKILASDISGKYSNPNELTQSDAMALHIAGRQRMLGHRIAKEVCGIATGSETLGTTGSLGETVAMYQVSLDALRNGLKDAGVNPPPNDAIRGELEGVNAIWGQNVTALGAIRDNVAPTPDNVTMVASLSSELMTDMSNIVTLYMLSTPGQEDVYRVPLAAYAESELTKWITNPDLVEAIKAQNVEHANLSQDTIDTLDLEWRAQEKANGGPLLTKLLERPASAWLREKQAETANFVTEVFAMDNKGLNVAQSVVTSDYWQGDESKWQKTIGDGSGNVHISEVEFDDSTGQYQSQVSMPVVDPATNELIGAVTFGINVQSLL